VSFALAEALAASAPPPPFVAALPPPMTSSDSSVWQEYFRGSGGVWCSRRCYCGIFRGLSFLGTCPPQACGPWRNRGRRVAAAPQLWAGRRYSVGGHLSLPPLRPAAGVGICGFSGFPGWSSHALLDPGRPSVIPARIGMRHHNPHSGLCLGEGAGASTPSSPPRRSEIPSGRPKPPAAESIHGCLSALSLGLK